MRRFGALERADGAIEWRVWAPAAQRVELVRMHDLDREASAMIRKENGVFSLVAGDVPEGARYAFRLDGGPERPDPCSLSQPEGVHGPSALVRTSLFEWSETDWRGIPLGELVFYELHVGTFTPEGTFEAVIPRLAALRDLGITAIELMPVGQFAGSRNWGYDGVCPFAAQSTYGGARGLQRLVDACHRHGLAIFLDVVYNHLGPEGNYLHEFGPYFTARYKTPWGMALNFDGSGSDSVRDFVLDNVRMWLEEFRFDGLRLDALHALHDAGVSHIVREIKDVAREVAIRHGRELHIVAESDLNDPRVLLPPRRGGYGVDAQWADDFHHAVHAYLTGERHGYYADYGRARDIAGVLACPFLFAGEYSAHRGRRHGARPPPELGPERFVVCLQNHDQIGNRARGERLAALLGEPAMRRLAASLLMLSGYLPLVFMGEEYGETNPFLYFCSFGDRELVAAVREGRKREFPDAAGQGAPDPQSEEAFENSRPSWSWENTTERKALRGLYRDLLSFRRKWGDGARANRRAELSPDRDSGPLLRFFGGGASEDGGELCALFNLGGECLAADTDRIIFSSESAAYGGARAQGVMLGEILPYECIVTSVPAARAGGGA